MKDFPVVTIEDPFDQARGRATLPPNLPLLLSVFCRGFLAPLSAFPAPSTAGHCANIHADKAAVLFLQVGAVGGMAMPLSVARSLAHSLELLLGFANWPFGRCF